MKKYNLQEWLESGVAEEYNLIADTQDKKDEDFQMIENAYEKFFVYKYIKEFQKDSIWEKLGKEKAKESFEKKTDKYKSIKDPDSYSKLLQEIYKTLWIDMEKISEEEKSFICYKKKKEYWIASDAMTSVQGVLTVALRNIIDKEKEPEKEELKHIKEMYESLKKLNKRQKYWTRKFCVTVVADLSTKELDKSLYKLIDKHYSNNILSEFMNRCFTVGNYCPVPKYFNSARSGPGARHDYWDLTLMKICDWYKKKEDKILEELLHVEKVEPNKKKDTLENCRNWLKWFEEKGKEVEKDGWHCFVDTLLMQDYVWNDYRVKEFWPDHSWENPGLPKDDEKIKVALEKINKRIKARSHRIVKELKGKEIGCH